MKRISNKWPVLLVTWLLCLITLLHYVYVLPKELNGKEVFQGITYSVERMIGETVMPIVNCEGSEAPAMQKAVLSILSPVALGEWKDSKDPAVTGINQESALVKENTLSLVAAENALAAAENERESLQREECGGKKVDESNEDNKANEINEENLLAEDGTAWRNVPEELPAAADKMEKVVEITPGLWQDYDTMVKRFYVIDSTTMADDKLLDPDRFLEKDLRVSKEGMGPQILIYHTHSREAFSDSEPGNESQTVTGVGSELTRILEDVYGYKVLHHVGAYDWPSRNGAYSRALPEIQKILEENPTIQVVIDLHRDEMPENVRLVTEIDGKKTARFMFFNGISRTKKTGELTYLYNEFLEDNLAFSFQMEKAAQEYYPNLTRKIYLKGYRYNMHVCPRTLLIELGAQNNTVEEAMNACEPLARLLDLVLSGEAR